MSTIGRMADIGMWSDHLDCLSEEYNGHDVVLLPSSHESENPADMTGKAGALSAIQFHASQHNRESSNEFGRILAEVSSFPLDVSTFETNELFADDVGLNQNTLTEANGLSPLDKRKTKIMRRSLGPSLSVSPAPTFQPSTTGTGFDLPPLPLNSPRSNNPAYDNIVLSAVKCSPVKSQFESLSYEFNEESNMTNSLSLYSEQSAFDAAPGIVTTSTASAEEDRIYRYLDNLDHASLCFDKRCPKQECFKMRAFIYHVNTCKQSGNGCRLCKRFFLLSRLHSKSCTKAIGHCSVLFCSHFKLEAANV